MLSLRLESLQVSEEFVDKGFINGCDIVICRMIFDSNVVDEVVSGDPVTDESIFPELFLFNNFVILEKVTNRRIFVFLRIEHEFKILDVHRIFLVPYSGKCFIDSHL